jgi:RelE-like HigB toxin of type II HigAB toxin-antitoxin system
VLRMACVPCMLSCLGVQLPCPGVRGAERQVKRMGVTARWGLKKAWSESAGRGARTADQVGKLVVLNIGGNKARLVAAMHDNRCRVSIRTMLTHAEYETGTWKK